MVRPLRPKIGGAVYILPNLLTTGNLFWGFFSIIKSLQGEFRLAAYAILLAAVFDILDGRVARWTKGTSEFGVQYDSLCDLISFGAAPAFLMYRFGLSDFGRIGWIICFLFMACGALRLARFNVQSSIGKASGDFTGLPIPMSAAVVACFVASVVEMQTVGAGDGVVWQALRDFASMPEFPGMFLIAAGPFLALAMVSNFVYRSHKTLKIKGIKPFRLLALLVFVVALIAYQPELIGFFGTLLYALSGPFEWIVGWKKITDDDDIFAPHHEDESMMEPDDGFNESGALGEDSANVRNLTTKKGD